MHSLLVALFLAASSFGVLAATCDVVNASTNTLVLISYAGPGLVSPGTHLPWPLDDTLNTVSVNGSNAATFTASPGHGYSVTLAADGSVWILDHSAGQTHWFWLGFAVVFVTGLLALGARWVRVVVGGTGGADNGGD